MGIGIVNVDTDDGHKKAREIPSNVLATLIPSSFLTVAELLSQRTDTSYSSAQIPCYSTDIPNTLIGDLNSIAFRHILLQRRPDFLAALKHISSLRKQFDDAWLSGAQSIRLPGDPLIRYPLWVEHLGDLEISTRKERSWYQASDWLNSTMSSSTDSNTYGLAEECFESLNDIQWDGVVPGLGRDIHLSNKDLATFLSDEWTNDDMIDAGTDFISRQLGCTSRVRILKTYFVENLRSLRLTHNTYETKSPRLLDRLITDGRVDTLFVRFMSTETIGHSCVLT
jgi:hypothetical protein